MQHTPSGSTLVTPLACPVVHLLGADRHPRMHRFGNLVSGLECVPGCPIDQTPTSRAAKTARFAVQNEKFPRFSSKWQGTPAKTARLASWIAASPFEFVMPDRAIAREFRPASSLWPWLHSRCGSEKEWQRVEQGSKAAVQALDCTASRARSEREARRPVSEASEGSASACVLP